MTNILYEKIVSPQTTSVDTLIELSELCRHSSYENYAAKLGELIHDLQSPDAQIFKQPLFTWAELGVESPCFRFERHRALMGAYSQTEESAEKYALEERYDEAAAAYLKSTRIAMQCAENLTQWTAIAMELRRSQPFDIHFLLAMVAAARSRAHKCKFLQEYKKKNEWKCGVMKPGMDTALHSVKEACRFAALSSLLWARPHKSKSGHVTTSIDSYEKELILHFHELSAFCAPNFQERLNHAAMCQDMFENMKEIMQLNEKLYYLTPQPREAPAPATVEQICTLVIQ